jgi:hypothetical protein
MNIKNFFKFIPIVAVITLSGCQPGMHQAVVRARLERLATPNMIDTQAIKEGDGVVVARVILIARNIETNQPNVMLTASRGSVMGFASSGFNLMLDPGETHHVILLPAGKYDWVEFWVQGLKSDFHGKLPFEVVAGKVTYIGDITLTIDGSDPWHYGMHISSEPSLAAMYMRSDYPGLMANYAFAAKVTVDNR